jgi:IS5 family transposase
VTGKRPGYGPSFTACCSTGWVGRTRSTGAAARSTARACRPKGGEATGPNPTDRGKPGSKRHVLVDAGGIPLAFALTPANVHDSILLEPVLDAVPPIRQCAGRPRKRPAKLHADKGYDYPRCRRACRRRRVVPRIARRGVESSERLGRHRWVVERTLAWFTRFGRLTVRYERRADIFAAFHHLAAALICLRFVERSSC